MTSRKNIGALGVLATFAAVVLVAMVSTTTRVKAMNDDDGKEDSRVRIGFEVAPVPLDLKGKDLRAVGLGSYLVNVVASCNDCHSAGPQTQYLPGHNPFFGQPAQTNPMTYLGGGRDFGALIPGSPDIISRNLTPDETGRPEGGNTFAKFRTIMRTGKDFDHLHPSCSATITSDCLPPPFDGALLQIMPWPNFQHLTDRDLWAIYQYLSSIPCIEGPTDPSNPLHNDCR